MSNPELTIYYSIVNLIDWYVAQGNDKHRASVEKLLEMFEEMTGNTPADIGEANDCGRCETWGEVIDGFQELTKNGERIPV